MSFLIMRETLALCLLGIGSYTDFRKHIVYPLPAVLVTAAGILLILLDGEAGWSYGVGFFIGGFLIAASVISHGSVGLGDGIFVIALSSLFPWDRVLADVLSGLLLCCLAAIYLLVFRHNRKDREMPFLPYLLAGHLLILLYLSRV